MEQLFNDIQQQIVGKMGADIPFTDEDYGQLEVLKNGETQYPVTFPCVLINMPETLWDNLKGSPQRGTVTITTRLALDCNNCTPDGSASTRLALAARLDSCLHGWHFNGSYTVLMRRTSRQYSLPGGIKIYETEYTTTIAAEAV